MSFFGSKDFALEVSRGNIPGVSSVIKYGRNTSFQAAEDIWDGGSIWVAPTVARIHDIASTDAGDDGAPVGVGARTIRVFGLIDWDTAEVSEDITMNGVTNVPTVNAYVMIHRLEVLTWGATDINVGIITATAQTDGTITARIGAGVGQSRMAVYGIPSTQTLLLTSFQGSISRAVPAANVDLQLLINRGADAELTHFAQKHRISLLGAGSSAQAHEFDPYQRIPGPAIVKLEGTSDTAATAMDAGFDGYLVDN